MNFGVGIYDTYVEIMEGSVDCWWNLDRILSLRSVVKFSWYLFIIQMRNFHKYINI